ncbi:MAG: hypothetical protein U9R60_12060 [Bacteroidota bacterium]|nr:hypothetical protein [Bacteroidota bacterium]
MTIKRENAALKRAIANKPIPNRLASIRQWPGLFSSPLKLSKTSYVVPADSDKYIVINKEWYSNGAFMIRKLPAAKDTKRLKSKGMFQPLTNKEDRTPWIDDETLRSIPVDLPYSQVNLNDYTAVMVHFKENYDYTPTTDVYTQPDEKKAVVFDRKYLDAIVGNFKNVVWSVIPEYNYMLRAKSNGRDVGFVMPIRTNAKTDLELLKENE